jgi:hypothetical protein
MFPAAALTRHHSETAVRADVHSFAFKHFCAQDRRSLFVHYRGEIIVSREIMSNKPPGLHTQN